MSAQHRHGCYRCDRSYVRSDECQRHFRKKHRQEYDAQGFDYSQIRPVLVGASAPSAAVSNPVAHPQAAPSSVSAHSPAALNTAGSNTTNQNLPDPPSLSELLEEISSLAEQLEPNPPGALALSPANLNSSNQDFAMDESSGLRVSHREKIPSAKIKEQVHKIMDKIESSPNRVNLPTYIAPRDPRFELDQKEIPKIYDHTKIGPNGERTDFFTLGNHVESKDKRYYIRAKRDPESLYFHAAEAPPLQARISDENHPQCAIDNLYSVFTKDMLGKSGELGNFTSKANVFAREGQFFWEAKVIAQATPQNNDSVREALAKLQDPHRVSWDRGSLRVGFCRRETFSGEPIGTSGYSYAVVLRPNKSREYGSVRFQSELHKVKGEDPGDLKPGDVVGLMITLPSLEVHKKVVQGTFNPADYPDLECGPAKPKAKSKVMKKKEKGAGKDKEKEVEVNKPKAKTEDDMNDERTLIRSALKAVTGYNIPVDHDIIRDRNPFIHKNGPCYFECPEYTPRPDLDRPTNATRQKTINPETGKAYSLTKETHPQHELPHLRTLPGSKIEIWVNGKYHGILWEHLLAFLPPASHIDTAKSRSSMAGDVDDGLLGYYPAVSHYFGGALECKFDGPWWYGYNDGPERPPARAIGERYKEQIIEDFCADIVDEIYLERLHKDTDYMKKEVLKTGKFNNKD